MEFLYRQHEQYPRRSIFWVHGANEERLKQSYEEIASALELPGRRQKNTNILSLVQMHLDSPASGPWLMVVDNVDDVSLFLDTTAERDQKLAVYLPKADRGSIVFTSRNKKGVYDLTLSAEPFVLQEMHLDECQQLLEGKLPPNLCNGPKDEYLAAMEYLPLAITVSAAFMVRNSIDIRTFLCILEDEQKDSSGEERASLRSEEARSNPVFLSWKLSFDHIRTKEPETADLLALMSMYERQAIPMYLLQGTDVTAFDFHRRIGTLIGFSLISFGQERYTYKIHRLVRLATRTWLQDHEKRKFSDSALQYVSNAFPSGLPETHEMCVAILPHAHILLKEQPQPYTHSLDRAALLRSVGAFMWRSGQYLKARNDLREAIAIISRVSGDNDPRALSAMNLLALVDSDLCGRDKERLNRHVLKAYEGIPFLSSYLPS